MKKSKICRLPVGSLFISEATIQFLITVLILLQNLLMNTLCRLDSLAGFGEFSAVLPIKPTELLFDVTVDKGYYC